MVKALSFFKRKAGMPVDEFQAYWRTHHPAVVTRLAGIRRYVQSHTLPAAYRKGEPVYDGIAEVWFDDTTAMHALRGTPAVAAVQADEARFIDHATMGLVITEEHVAKAGDGATRSRQERGLRPAPARDGRRGLPAPLARNPRTARPRGAWATALRAESPPPGRLRARSHARLGWGRQPVVRRGGRASPPPPRPSGRA